ncbi:MAG: DUF6307 family protein [Actinomycetota bacterium]|nr:DUF6307 family protein [Actinomycetota bacterium]MDQ3577918.1 DUF6307 family protein [Actinomycetota bacterium]
MAKSPDFVSRYDLRVQLVHDVIAEHSKVNKKTAFDLAVRVVGALDREPARVR